MKTFNQIFSFLSGRLTFFLLGMAFVLVFFVDFESFYRNHLYDSAIYFGTLLLYSSPFLIIFFLILRQAINWFFRKKLGMREASAAEIAQRFAEVIAKRHEMHLYEFQEHVQQLALAVISLNAFMSTNRLIFGTIVASVTAIGGTIGTIVLIKQNEKIAEQTKVLETQTSLLETDAMRTKSAERDEIFREISKAADPMNKGQLRQISQKYRDSRGSGKCFELSSQETSQPDNVALAKLEQDIEAIRLRVGDALSGLSGRAEYGKKIRNDLFKQIVQSGLPFSIFAKESWGKLNLKGQQLAGANLDLADLKRRSNFQTANLSGSCVDYADFGGSVFTRTNFSSARLLGVSFFGAGLSHSSFERAVIGRSQHMPTKTDQDIKYGEYSDPKPPAQSPKRIVKISFWEKQSNRIRCWFNRSVCEDTDTEDSYTREWVLMGTADFDWTTTDSSDDWVHVTGNRFGDSNMQTWNFDQRYQEEDYSKNHKPELVNFSNSRLVGANFTSARMQEVSFEHTLLVGADFSSAELENPASFEDSLLAEADFRFAASSMDALRKSNFKGANLTQTIVDGLDFGFAPGLTEAQLRSACVCSDAYPKFQGQVIKLEACKAESHKHKKTPCGRLATVN